MKLLFLGLLFAVLSVASAAVCNNCTGGVENGLFTAAGYGTWGLIYVRDGTRPQIRAQHPATITKAVITIHGNGRNAYDYYCYTKYAIEAAGQYGNTYLISPRFALISDVDRPANGFGWPNSDSWKEGGRSADTTSRISSFQILDDIILVFNNRTLYPGLTEIIIAGHSAGGQTGQRYAIASGIDNLSALPIRYVIANPGTYGYLDAQRPVLETITPPSCTYCVVNDLLNHDYTFFDGAQAGCAGFNDWKFGLDNKNVYANARSNAVITAEYEVKDITYIHGSLDNCNTELLDPNACSCSDVTLDKSCPAALSGKCRFERGVAFYQYLQHFYNSPPSNPVHEFFVVFGVGHDGCGMINSTEFKNAMFA